MGWKMKYHFHGARLIYIHFYKFMKGKGGQFVGRKGPERGWRGSGGVKTSKAQRCICVKMS